MRISFRKKEKQKLFDIFIDDEYVRSVDWTLFKKKFPETFECENVLEFERLFFEVESKVARQYIFKRLAKRNLHSDELQKELKKRHFSHRSIALVLDECKKEGWLKDEDWLEGFIGKEKKKGRSALEIRQKLQFLGVNIERGSELISDNSESLQNLIKKKFPKLLDTAISREEKHKILGKLTRRGFSLREITQAMQQNDN